MIMNMISDVICFSTRQHFFGKKIPVTVPNDLNLKSEVTGIMLNVSGIIGNIQNETKIIKIDQRVSEL